MQHGTQDKKGLKLLWPHAGDRRGRKHDAQSYIDQIGATINPVNHDDLAQRDVYSDSQKHVHRGGAHGITRADVSGRFDPILMRYNHYDGKSQRVSSKSLEAVLSSGGRSLGARGGDNRNPILHQVTDRDTRAARDLDHDPHESVTGTLRRRVAANGGAGVTHNQGYNPILDHGTPHHDERAGRKNRDRDRGRTEGESRRGSSRRSQSVEMPTSRGGGQGQVEEWERPVWTGRTGREGGGRQQGGGGRARDGGGSERGRDRGRQRRPSDASSTCSSSTVSSHRGKALGNMSLGLF